jgi:hypothetical protein
MPAFSPSVLPDELLSGIFNLFARAERVIPSPPPYQALLIWLTPQLTGLVMIVTLFVALLIGCLRVMATRGMPATGKAQPLLFVVVLGVLKLQSLAGLTRMEYWHDLYFASIIVSVGAICLVYLARRRISSDPGLVADSYRSSDYLFLQLLIWRLIMGLAFTSHLEGSAPDWYSALLLVHVGLTIAVLIAGAYTSWTRNLLLDIAGGRRAEGQS